MNLNTQELKYDTLVKKIQRNRKLVIAFTIIAVFAVILITTPTQLEIMGETIIDYKGLHPVVIVLLVLLCFFIELIAYAIVSLPLTTSMDQECDPAKHLILNAKLNKQKNIDYIYAVDYLFLGDYQKSLEYAEKMITSSKEPMILSGLFNKARCEFLLGNYDGLKQVATQYANILSTSKKLKPKAQIAYQKIHTIVKLLCAIADNEPKKIKELCNSIESWNKSKATEGFIKYLKGVSAYKVDDKEEAIYRFKAVKEDCSKTVFASLADDYLSFLK